MKKIEIHSVQKEKQQQNCTSIMSISGQNKETKISKFIFSVQSAV